MEIFVGCSCSNKIDNKFLKLAEDVGNLIGKNNHNLIFGSSEDGMMGEVYRATKKTGGKVTAIIPENYRGMLTEVKADKVITTDTPTEQLKKLVNTGDVTIILPGSFGTLAELIISIQNKKLGEHNKKIYIVNTYGYFDDLLKMIDKAYLENFDYYNRDELYTVVENPKEIFEQL